MSGLLAAAAVVTVLEFQNVLRKIGSIKKVKILLLECYKIYLLELRLIQKKRCLPVVGANVVVAAT